MTQRKFGIVGGGLTGLTAAYRLVQAGHDVTIFEASDTLGGLAAGFDLAGHRVERAYHFLYKTDEYILALCEELGLSDALTYHKSSVSTYYGGKLYPMMTPLDLIKFSPLGFIDRIRAGVTVLWLQRIKDWRSLSKITALDWLRKNAGRRVTDVIWEPLLRGKFDRYYDKVTMSWLWGRVVQRVDSRDAKLGGEALGYFKGGFKIIIDRLIEPITAGGGKFRMKTPVRNIDHDEANDQVIVTTAAGEDRFDRVLATVPSDVLAKMIGGYENRDPEFFDKLRSIDYLDAVLQVFASKQKITDFYWHNVNTPNAPFVVFLSLTELVGAQTYDGLNIYYIGAYVPREHQWMTAEPAEVKRRWYAEIRKIFPDFDQSQIIDDALFRLRNAQHIVDIGFEENKLLPHQTPCPGVLMCNFSQIYPMDRGTNYAVRDGNRMAERLLEGLGEGKAAGNIRILAPASFIKKENEVSVDRGDEPRAQAARTNVASERKGGWMSALGRFLQRRPWSAAVIALCAMLVGGTGAVFAGFEISHRGLPTYEIWKRADRVLEAACCLTVPDAIPSTTYKTGLLKLVSDVRPVKLDFKRSKSNLADFSPMSFTGGGMVSFRDDLLLLPYDGKIYAAKPGEDARMTGIRAPETHREAYQALAKDPAYGDYTFELNYIRYNDLVDFDNASGRGLLASYTEFDPEQKCYLNAVARLDIDRAIQSIDQVKTAPGDWKVLYRSKPCLPLKKRMSALEGQLAGGRMVVKDQSTVILTMGDFHFDGMRSEGSGIGQDPNAEYGKTIAIDIDTGASRIFSTGHRNPQGIAIDATGEIYAVEHGPKGGDELNHIIEGRNYGWPKESFGLTYDSKKLPEAISFGRHEEFEAPIFAWMPSPALSSLIYVKPGFHQAWDGDFLAGSLVEQSLHRIRFSHGKPAYSETIPIGARVRAIHQRDDGQIVLWTDNQELIWLRAEDLTSNEDVLGEYFNATRISGSMAVKLETAIARCVECHSFDIGDSARAPSLARVYDDQIASTSYPRYSAALAGKKGRWTKNNLAKFLVDPQAFAPGTMMPAVAGEDPKVIDKIVDFLAFYDNRF